MKTVYDLKATAQDCMKSKEKPVPQLNDHEWLYDFRYLTDIYLHLNELNFRLQGKDNLIHNLLATLNFLRTNFVNGKSNY